MYIPFQDLNQESHSPTIQVSDDLWYLKRTTNIAVLVEAIRKIKPIGQHLIVWELFLSET